jgi:hypothetical protein
MKMQGMHKYWMHDICMACGVGCAIVGIIGDVTNTVPGLEPTNWFLMGIGFLAAGIITAVMHLVDTTKK